MPTACRRNFVVKEVVQAASARARLGVTLIEAVLFIAVALGVIEGRLVLYQQAALAARTQEAVHLFSAIVQDALFGASSS